MVDLTPEERARLVKALDAAGFVAAVARVKTLSDGAMAAFRYLAEVAGDDSAPRRHRLRAAIGLAERCPPEVIRVLRHKAPAP
jgi:isopropylmalate/homocitrate/citramalate synthase